MIKEKVEILGSSLPFYRYEVDGIVYFEFDASDSDCPEPMLNAMKGLQNISSFDERVVMINMQEPSGLYPRIESDFSWVVEKLDDDLFKIIFRKKDNSSNHTNFDHVSCG